MSTIDNPELYDDLLNLITDGIDGSRLLSYRLPSSAQQRLDGILEKNRTGQLSETEAAELDSFEQLEHLVRLIKAKVLRRQGQ